MWSPVAQLAERKTGDRRFAVSSLTTGGVAVILSLSKSLYLLFSTGSTQKDPSWHDWKIVDWEVKTKQNFN